MKFPKIISLLFLSTAAMFSLPSSAEEAQEVVLIKTTKGNIRVTLYNDTPRHRDQFLKLVKEHFYDGLLFHRVIPNFMIQAGDSASRHAVEGQKLGDSPEPYQVEAEIVFPKHYHKCGALAAARESDDVNPTRASSYSQFYIVFGNLCTDERLASAQVHLDTMTNGTIKLTPEIKETYRQIGGTPHLDGQYTVFGEVIEGIDTVDLIQWASRDENDRPLDDIRIIEMVAEGPKPVSKLFGE